MKLDSQTEVTFSLALTNTLSQSISSTLLNALLSIPLRITLARLDAFNGLMTILALFQEVGMELSANGISTLSREIPRMAKRRNLILNINSLLRMLTSHVLPTSQTLRILSTLLALINQSRRLKTEKKSLDSRQA